MARNATFADLGFLGGCRYLLHDRDTKFCAGFDAILKSVGIEAVRLPPRSPNLNAHCERGIRSTEPDANAGRSARRNWLDGQAEVLADTLDGE